MALVSDPDIFNPMNSNDVYNVLQSNSAANNAFNAQMAQRQMDFQSASNAKAMDFEHREAELNRDWQKMMSDTAYQRQVADMVAAGLNPVLGVANSGASVGSGAHGRGVSSAGGTATADTSVNGAMANFVSSLINGETQRVTARTNAEASHYASDISAINTALTSEAHKYAANASAGAMRYSAAAAAAASKYVADANIAWNREYAQNYSTYGLINQALEYLDSGKDTGNASKFLDDIFKNNIGNEGVALALKNGKTALIFTLKQLRGFWNDLSSSSKYIFEHILQANAAQAYYPGQ